MVDYLIVDYPIAGYPIANYPVRGYPVIWGYPTGGYPTEDDYVLKTTVMVSWSVARYRVIKVWTQSVVLALGDTLLRYNSDPPSQPHAHSFAK